MNKYIYRCFFALGLLGATVTSCSDEIDYGTTVEEGLPAEITVKVSLPEMKSVSRSDIAEGLDKEVNSLWIGIYNVNTGKLTGSYTGTPSTTPSHEAPKNVTINTKTGRSYIVAVANYTGRFVHNGTGVVSAESALADADTWAKFNALSAMFSNEGNIDPDVPFNALIMSGHYMGVNHANGDYTTPEPVVISKTGTLAGSIHLRRLISQIKFNVTYNADNIASFDIQSWQVKNIPNQSWLYENENTSPANVGDNRILNQKTSYQDSEVYTHTDENVAARTWSFDWWQLENKRTGLDPTEEYNIDGDYYTYREAEFKDNDNDLNTGKYKSLVASATSEDANNNATFVELKVRMTLKVDENGNAYTDGTTRMADCVYTIHLGYCEGTGKSKAQDFNCRRNTKYTYNVRVEKVNKIFVEANKLGEPSPGSEGVISDVTNQFVELDAHYGVYNIYLSDEDLNVFDYMIICYDENSAQVRIDSTDGTTVPAEGSTNRKYLDWVEISPSDVGVLAAYKPGLMTLDEFKTSIANGTSTAGWYTLFFNEYVYEDNTGGNESGSTNWRDYVNMPDRQAWIRIQMNESTDKESAYYKSKYAFSQKSIQTYYNDNATTALGMEHVNESFGLNLRNTFNTTTYGANADNGRYNVAQYISNSTSETITFWQTSRFLWSGYVTQESPQTVAAINNTDMKVEAPARTLTNPYPVPALATLTGQTKYTSDPDQSTSPQYIEAVNVCMNRNRDLNGNGYIDANELRWYVPTTNIYTRMILGRRSLTTPIMNYSAYPELNYYNKDRLNGALPNLILYGSDGKVLWAMEGVSTSTWDNGSTNQNFGPDGDEAPRVFPRYTTGTPWQVRCVRNLGTNLSTVSNTRKADPAYRVRSGAIRTIEMINYESRSVRQEKITEMVPHDIANQDYNRCYKAFQYASTAYNISDCTGYRATYSTDNGLQAWLKASNPCDRLNTYGETGWRVPNQKEIAIMNTLGISPADRNFYISATFSHYDTNGKGLTALSDLDDNTRTFKVMMTRSNGEGTQRSFQSDDSYVTRQIRCVRDVD